METSPVHEGVLALPQAALRRERLPDPGGLLRQAQHRRIGHLKMRQI